MKEIRIFNELKCENVVKVEGFCSQPLAVMLEYPNFVKRMDIGIAH